MKYDDSLIKFLDYLDLNLDESRVFISLIENGELSILEISRIKKISRTNVYRIIERLLKKGIIEEIQYDNKKLYKPSSKDKFELIISEEKSRVDYLSSILPSLDHLFPKDLILDQPGSKVKFYEGTSGIKQMIWNNLQARTEVLGYTFRSLEEVVGKDFAIKWMQEFSLRELIFKDIISEYYLDSLRSYSDLSKFVPNFKNETRFIPNQVLNITQQMDIYNNTVAYYYWHEGNIFGIEIYNALYANFQKQLFNIAWVNSKNIS